MAISSITSAGLQGVQAGIGRVNQAGGQIARAGSTADTGNLSTPIVNLNVGEIQVKASANVIKTGDQMLGTLIDIKA